MQMGGKFRHRRSRTSAAILAGLTFPCAIFQSANGTKGSKSQTENKEEGEKGKENEGRIQTKQLPPPQPVVGGKALAAPPNDLFSTDHVLGRNGEPREPRGILKLSRELRHMIYLEFLIDKDIVVNLHNRTLWSCRRDIKKETRANDILSLLVSCRQVYYEVNQVVYGTMTFIFQSMPAFLAFYAAVPTAQRNVIQTVHLDIDPQIAVEPSHNCPFNSSPHRPWPHKTIDDHRFIPNIPGRRNFLPRFMLLKRPTWWQATSQVLTYFPALKSLTVDAPSGVFGEFNGDDWDKQLMEALHPLKDRVDFVVAARNHHFTWEDEPASDDNGGSIWTWSAKEKKMTYERVNMTMLWRSDY